jgi:4-hydroxy-4-methyl-2-oxoglutarate aldolase
VADANLLAALQTFDSGTLANALDHLGLRVPSEGFASARLRAQFPDLPPVVGFAVTCREDTTTTSGIRAPFDPVYDALRGGPHPAIVVCQDVGMDAARSCHLGDVMAARMQSLGAVGFVTDGAVRDIRGISVNAPGFQVVALGAVPAAGSPSLIDVGTVVSLDGLVVAPGDLLVIDANGVLSIPQTDLPAVIEEAGRIIQHERQLIESIHATPSPARGAAS